MPWSHLRGFPILSFQLSNGQRMPCYTKSLHLDVLLSKMLVITPWVFEELEAGVAFFSDQMGKIKSFQVASCSTLNGSVLTRELLLMHTWTQVQLPHQNSQMRQNSKSLIDWPINTLEWSREEGTQLDQGGTGRGVDSIFCAGFQSQMVPCCWMSKEAELYSFNKCQIQLNIW